MSESEPVPVPVPVPVPKILHQTWKTAEVPEEWRAFARSWRELHPGWQYQLWTDEANRAFVAEHYPKLLATFDGYSYGIQRADAIRYCLLHHFGGVYVDLDIECLQPIDDLIDVGGFVGVLEPEVQGERLGRPSLLSNAFMASSPGHPLLTAVIDALAANPSPGLTHRDVLESTGPLMLDAVFEKYQGGGVTVLPSHTFFPFLAGSVELAGLRKGDRASLRAELVHAGTYAAHYWANSWIGSLAGELINPDPDNIEGFEFIQGWDSPGHDIANVGRDIAKAAIAAGAVAGAVAFNTDGFVKGALLPLTLWFPMGDGAPNEGIYIKRQPPRRGVIQRLRSLLPHR